MIDNNIIFEVFMKIFTQVVDDGNTSGRLMFHLGDTGVTLVAEVTFNVEGLDDNHV